MILFRGYPITALDTIYPDGWKHAICFDHYEAEGIIDGAEIQTWCEERFGPPSDNGHQGGWNFESGQWVLLGTDHQMMEFKLRWF